jgi:hypothetical protein
MRDVILLSAIALMLSGFVLAGYAVNQIKRTKPMRKHRRLRKTFSLPKSRESRKAKKLAFLFMVILFLLLL